jgi:hypothetical protein
MSIFTFFRKRNKTADNRPEVGGTRANLPFSDNFSILNIKTPLQDNYSYNAWVNIAVNILICNIARADFMIKRDEKLIIEEPGMYVERAAAPKHACPRRV